LKAIVHLKYAVNYILGLFNLRIINLKNQSDLNSRLDLLLSLGVKFNTIIDGGAAYGNFSKMAMEKFGSKFLLLFEPLIEYEKFLLDIKKKYNAIYIQKALHFKNQSIFINVHPDLEGSSIYEEFGPKITNGFKRKIQTIALDSLDIALQGPFLIKLDIQGSELDAILGARNLISSNVENILIIEMNIKLHFKNSRSNLISVINELNNQNYIVFDIFNMNYRKIDNALCQIDMVFINKNSKLNKKNYYANYNDRVQDFLKAKKKFNKFNRNLNK
jgi:FkbM family methyltransferase